MTIRPDSMDLIGPDYDRECGPPATRTLIICAGPRTGSYELCRFLGAAGVGVPHEYFNSRYARLIAMRWGLGDDPLSEANIARYVDELRRRRAVQGVFAVKLMYLQLEMFLRNQHGAALFDGATVVHLYRPDIVSQLQSWRRALASGQWDFSNRQTTPPREPVTGDGFQQISGDIDALVTADAVFRKLFALLGIRPLFVTTDELFADPVSVVTRIASAVGTPIQFERLARMIALSAPYQPNCTPEQTDAPPSFRDQAFRLQSSDDATLRSTTAGAKSPRAEELP